MQRREERYKTRTVIDRLLELQISGLPEILGGRLTADCNVVKAYRTVIVADDEPGLHAAFRGPCQAQRAEQDRVVYRTMKLLIVLPDCTVRT